MEKTLLNKMNTQLQIEKNSFSLRVYCPTCKRQYYYNNIQKCEHFDKQFYKSIVYGEGSVRKTRQYKTRKWGDALISAIEFKKHVKTATPIVIETVLPDEISPQYISIKEAANLFLRFKHDDGVQPHQVRNLSEQYLDSMRLYIQQFIDSMRKNGYKVDQMPISQINEVHVGQWYMTMTEHYSRGSWNAPITILRLWIEYMKDRRGVNMYNPFKDAKLVQVENNVEAITKDEFEGVCQAVGTTSPYNYLGGKTTKRKNRFRPYLVDTFKLALLTGLRREEIMTLTWRDIQFIDDEFGYMIITDNLKVERMTQKKYAKKYIPIYDELEKFLTEMGWKELKGSDYFIIEPHRTATLKTLMNNMSKGFTHYYKQAFPGRPLKQQKVLRKTYLTYLAKHVDSDVVHFSSHSGIKVLEDHYFDKKILAKGFGMKMFG